MTRDIPGRETAAVTIHDTAAVEPETPETPEAAAIAAAEGYMAQLEDLTARTHVFIGRAKERAAFRKAQGRHLSAGATDGLRQLATSMDAIAREAEDMLRAGEPAEPDAQVLSRIHRDILDDLGRREA